MSRPLTSQQQAVYDYIRDRIISRGYGPTVREIGEHMNIKSPNGVMCHLRALERKGMIIRSANKSRAIELTEALPRGDMGLAIQGWISGGAIQMLVGSAQELDLNKVLSQGEHFLLEVRDESLVDAQIKTGDQLIIRRQSLAPQGQVVLIKVSEESNMLGYIHPDSGRIRLQPLAPSLPPVMLDQLHVLGVVVGVVRLFSAAVASSVNPPVNPS